MKTTSKEIIAANLAVIKARIEQAAGRSGREASEVKLVGATKTVSPQALMAAYEAGVVDFGENYVQEAVGKRQMLDALGVRPRWHLIGHLQRNKVTRALGVFDVIQSVDSVRLGEEIARRARQAVPIMLEVNVAGEASKYGIAPDEVEAVFQRLNVLPNLSISGLMTMAPYTQDPEEVRPFFRRLRQIRDELGLKELSMGMSGDYEVAVEEGATMIRVGTALFGSRE